MEASFPAMIDSAERSHQRSIGNSQVVVQQYARYPSGLESTIQSASSLESARGQADTHRSPPLHRKDTPRSIQPSPRGVRSVLPTSSTGRTGPSMSPPLFDVFRQSPMKDTTDQVESRCLPSREVSDENIDDAYVTFILYCNPNVPSSVDTSELRKTFRSPPRSDGKSFSVFNLFQLIQKLDNKELKTWIQLAIELGVEPPSQEKKQSTQKVQQYAVRLKVGLRLSLSDLEILWFVFNRFLLALDACNARRCFLRILPGPPPSLLYTPPLNWAVCKRIPRRRATRGRSRSASLSSAVEAKAWEEASR